MAAPVVDPTALDVDDSAVWDVYRALCGALLGSSRTEVWTILTDPELRSAAEGTEDSLFRAAAFLISALRVEAAGGSPAADLRAAHDLIKQAVALSEVRVW